MANVTPPLPVPIEPSSSQNQLSLLSPHDIGIRFRHHGALLFRGFSPTIGEFKFWTAQFCKYFIAYPGNKRDRVGDETDIQTVDVRKPGISLHSELSYSPVRPNIAWFFCVTPPSRGGATILCDGIALAEALPSALKAWLENRKLRFQAVLEPGTWRKMLGCDTAGEARDIIRQRSYADMAVAGESIHIDHLTAPMRPPKYDKRVAFCNNLILHHGIAGGVPFADGSTLPEALYAQLVEVSKPLTAEVHWEAGDILMIDNTRVMHGRRPVLDDKRLIVTRFGS